MICNNQVPYSPILQTFSLYPGFWRLPKTECALCQLPQSLDHEGLVHSACPKQAFSLSLYFISFHYKIHFLSLAVAITSLQEEVSTVSSLQLSTLGFRKTSFKFASTVVNFFWGPFVAERQRRHEGNEVRRNEHKGPSRFIVGSVTSHQRSLFNTKPGSDKWNSTPLKEEEKVFVLRGVETELALFKGSFSIKYMWFS